MFYYWVRIEQPYQLQFIQAQLEEECTRQDLNIDADHMHRYESAASGLKYPHVWDYLWGTAKSPRIEHIMYICDAAFFEDLCGPDVKPAEDVPEDEDDGLPTAGTAAMDLDSPPCLGQTNAPAASGRKEQPVCQDVVDAPIKAATADTAPAAEEA